jgi:NhaA family Na+:H+ antiporter
MSRSPELPPRPIDRLIYPFQAFAGHKLAGAVLLLIGAALGVVAANSPWAEAYHHLLETPIHVGWGEAELSKDVHHWVNDGLMGIFFFLVGLEIKREVLAGELSGLRKASLPAFAAVGGMVVPAAIYFALNPAGEAAGGWGIPMATDIAFALGVLALLGDRVPLGLKVFLTALAIVDDIGAVLVIAIFYTADVSLVSLGIGGALFAVAVALNVAGVRNSLAYFLLGSAVWLAFLQSGVHATIAALLMAFTIPARTHIDGDAFAAKAKELLRELEEVGLPEDHELNDTEQQYVLDRLGEQVSAASAPLSQLEHALNPLVTLVVLPVFAFANAGVSLGGTFVEALASPVTLGVLAGLFVGKQVGVALFAWLAVKIGLADLPRRVSWRQIHGAAVLGGIGFTMSLFIAGLAFARPAMLERAKVGILVGSLLSGVVGYLLIRAASGGTSARGRARDAP